MIGQMQRGKALSEIALRKRVAKWFTDKGIGYHGAMFWVVLLNCEITKNARYSNKKLSLYVMEGYSSNLE